MLLSDARKIKQLSSVYKFYDTQKRGGLNLDFILTGYFIVHNY